MGDRRTELRPHNPGRREDDWLTPKQYSEAVHIPLKSLYRLIKCGKLKVLRVGKQVRIPKPEAT